MTNSASAMTFDLTQSHIDQLDAEQYSLFLAYGDTFRDTETGRTGARSLELRETEIARISPTLAREELRISKCVWNSKHLSRSA